MARCSGVLGGWAVVWKPGARSFETGAGALPAQALPPAAGPCSPGSRCFIGISLGLVSVEGLPAAGGPTWVNARSVAVERGGRENRLGRRPDGRRAARRP